MIGKAREGSPAPTTKTIAAAIVLVVFMIAVLGAALVYALTR